MKKVILGALIFSMVFSVGIFSAQAQETAKKESCDDYYSMGDLSVGVVISPEEPSNIFSSGKTGKFFIVAQNGSKIVIPDVALLVRVEKLEVIKGEKKTGIVDKKTIKEEILPERLTLNPGELKQIDYVLNVPSEIENGAYTIKVFPLRGSNINIERYGFDFFEMSAAANERPMFEIRNGKEGDVVLEEKGVKINGVIYAGMGVDFNQSGDFAVTQSLKNFFAENKDLMVEQTLFHGNYFSEENKINSVSSKISVVAGKTADINFTIPKDKIKIDSSLPYYLRAKISYAGGEFVTTIPIFNKDNYLVVNPTFSYFPLLTKFPVKKGEQGEALVCFDQTKKFSGMKIEMTLKDENGNVVSQIGKDLDETAPASSLEKALFTANKDYNFLTMETKISQGGEVADVYTFSYGQKGMTSSGTEAVGMNKNKINYKIVIIIFIVLALIGVLIIFLKKRANGKNNLKGGMAIFLALVCLGIGLGNVAQASDFSFFITQTNVGLVPEGYSTHQDGSNGGGGFDCGGDKTAVGLSATQSKYWLQAHSDGSSAFTNNANGGGIIFPAGTAVGTQLDFNFLRTKIVDQSAVIDTSANYPLKPLESYYLDKRAPILQPFQSVIKVLPSSVLNSAIVASVGWLNAPAPAGVLAWRIFPDKNNKNIVPFIGAGFGVVGVFQVPQRLSTDAIDNSYLAQNVDCASFTPASCKTDLCNSLGGGVSKGNGCTGLKNTLDQAICIGYQPLKKNNNTNNGIGQECCAPNGGTWNANLRTCDGLVGSTLATYNTCVETTCCTDSLGAKGVYSDNFGGTYAKCQTQQEFYNQGATECNNIGTSCNANKGFFDGKKNETFWEKIQGALTSDWTTVESLNESVLKCQDLGGKCSIVGSGTATVKVTLGKRFNALVFMGIPNAIVTLPPNVCIVDNSPPSIGIGYANPTTTTFTVRVEGIDATKRLLTIKNTCNSSDIKSVPGGIDCVFANGQSFRTCSASYALGSKVNLTAAYAYDANNYYKWDNVDTFPAQTNTSASVTMNADKIVTFECSPPTGKKRLKVFNNCPGIEINSIVSGINKCLSTSNQPCVAYFNTDTDVELSGSGKPSPGYSVPNWVNNDNSLIYPKISMKMEDNQVANLVCANCTWSVDLKGCENSAETCGKEVSQNPQCLPDAVGYECTDKCVGPKPTEKRFCPPCSNGEWKEVKPN